LESWLKDWLMQWRYTVDAIKTNKNFVVFPNRSC
jgi:hypothetical protein